VATESESKNSSPNPLPFCPPERFGFARDSLGEAKIHRPARSEQRSAKKFFSFRRKNWTRADE